MIKCTALALMSSNAKSNVKHFLKFSNRNINIFFIISDYNDLFFFTKHDEELWGSCKSVVKSEKEVEELKNSVQFKPVMTPIFETFEKDQIIRF